MLLELLKLMKGKNILNQVEIARQLGVPTGLVAEMTLDLTRRGYLKEDNARVRRFAPPGTLRNLPHPQRLRYLWCPRYPHVVADRKRRTGHITHPLVPWAQK